MKCVIIGKAFNLLWIGPLLKSQPLSIFVPPYSLAFTELRLCCGKQLLPRNLFDFLDVLQCFSFQVGYDFRKSKISLMERARRYAGCLIRGMFCLEKSDAKAMVTDVTYVLWREEHTLHTFLPTDITTKVNKNGIP